MHDRKVKKYLSLIWYYMDFEMWLRLKNKAIYPPGKWISQCDAHTCASAFERPSHSMRSALSTFNTLCMFLIFAFWLARHFGECMNATRMQHKCPLSLCDDLCALFLKASHSCLKRSMITIRLWIPTHITALGVESWARNLCPPYLVPTQISDQFH